MVEAYTPKHFRDLTDFIRNHPHEDFYFTKNNTRHCVRDESVLKELLKESNYIYFVREKGDIQGVILVWKSLGNNVPRYYIKVNTSNPTIARQLLTVLLWNVKKELCIKIKKDSPLLKLFKDKGFDFCGDRGKEVLLISKNLVRKNYGNNHPNNKNPESTR